MLSAKRLPEILRTVLDDGVMGACLMTTDGSVLCSVADKTIPDTVNETALAAISSSIMNNYIQGCGDASFVAMKFEHGCLAVTAAGKGYLIAAYGKSVALGLLRGRLLTLSQYFSRILDQIK